jgi:type IV pilus assembly protein PilB
MPEPIQRGELNDSSFARVYYAIAGHGKTGVLEIMDDGDRMVRKRLYFLAGDSSFVMFGPQTETLGQILVDRKVINDDQLEEAIEEVALSQKPLGKIMADRGWVTPEKLHELLVFQTEIKTISCFGFRQGHFSFKEESVAQFNHDVSLFKVNPDRIVYAGVDQHYSLDRLEHEFEHVREKGLRVAAGSESRFGNFAFQPDELEFIEGIGSGVPFSSMLSKSPLGLTRTLKLLYVLMVTGLVEVTAVQSIGNVKVKEPETVRRKAKVLELDDIPDDEGEEEEDERFRRPRTRSRAAAPAGNPGDAPLAGGGGNFAELVTDYLGDQMKKGPPADGTKDLVKYEESSRDLAVSQLSNLLRDHKSLALNAYLAKGGTDGATKLGDLLLQNKLVEPGQLQVALAKMRTEGTSFLNSLVASGAIDDEALHDLLSEHYKVPAVKLSELELDQDIVSLIPENLAKKYRAIPINKTGRTLVVAMADPHNIDAIDEIKFLLEYNIEVVVATENEIKQALDKYHDSTEMLDDVMANFDDSDIDVADMEDDFDVKAVSQESEGAPVVKLVNQILIDALHKGASDVHFEPYESAFRIRYRIDGVLYHVISPPHRLRNALVSRVKIISKLDISERRLPQDGRVSLKIGKRKIDFRVSTLPTLWGEKMVMRILDKESLELDLTKLGMEQDQLDDLRWALHQPYGMCLVTGPSGCGKTTTLYSALIELNKVTENISTAEDPVEYYLEGINQVQMHDEVGLNFAFTLRSFLRQDPDIIMVGEIRDFETAEIAVKAALTGHVVLTTIHTNDAPSTINRLLNMGVEPFLITAAVTAVMSQRLVRKLCPACKAPEDHERVHLLNVGVPAEEIADFKAMKSVGCPQCLDRGFKGRLGLYEIMTVKGELSDFILNGATPSELKREAIRQGMRTMRMVGLTKVKEGLTTLAEITRTTMPDYSGHAPVDEG